MVNLKPQSSHTRKISLPSPSHPLLVCVEQNLQKLQLSEGVSLSVSQQFNGLNTLCESLDDALHLPLSQLDFPKQSRSKWEEHILDGSIELLDMCGKVRECFSVFMEGIKGLESSIRRRRSPDKSGHEDHEVDACMDSNKKLHKMVSKCIKDIKKAEKHYRCRVYAKNISDCCGLNGSSIITLLQEVQQISFTILGSSLSFIYEAKVASKSKLSGWSLVSKLLQQRKVVSFEGDEEMDVNQVLRIEKKLNPLHMENVVRNLKSLECNIEGVEKELEAAFRLLLKTRVSLLNMFNY